MEWLRLALVYIHLIACCVALGLICKSDWTMLRQLLRGDYDYRYRAAAMDDMQATVGAALSILWLSGSLVIMLDASIHGVGYFYNPKLQAKILVALAVTANGVLLHRQVLPAWRAAGSLLQLSWAQYGWAIFSAAMSIVSWLYAAFLGAGQQLSWKYPLWELLAAYPLFIVATAAALLWLIRRTASSHLDGAAPSQPL